MDETHQGSHGRRPGKSRNDVGYSHKYKIGLCEILSPMKFKRNKAEHAENPRPDSQKVVTDPAYLFPIKMEVLSPGNKIAWI